MMRADGFDEAILGVAQRCGQPEIIAYDTEKILEILQAREGMTAEEAVEYFEFNIAGAWVGEETPIFIDRRNLYGHDEVEVDPRPN
jgi:hypothetical protein